MFEVLKTRYSAWKRVNRTISELEGLSFRQLEDLGIARGDIPALASKAVHG